MRGRRRAVRSTPLAIDVQQGGLFLRAGDGNTEIVVVAGSGARQGGRSHGAPQDGGDLVFVQRRGFDPAHVTGSRAVRQELQRTHAVPSDLCEQFEGIGGSGAEELVFMRGARLLHRGAGKLPG